MTEYQTNRKPDDMTLIWKALQQKGFRETNTTEQRVKYVLESIKRRDDFRIEFQQKIDVYSVNTDKDVSKARDFRNKGIEFYEQKQNYRAIPNFSLAIRFASHIEKTDTSDELYLGYRQRAIVYYELKDYESSLYDIDQALEICQTLEDYCHRINCLRFLQKYSKALEMITELLSGKYSLSESEIQTLQGLQTVIQNETTGDAQEIAVENDCYLFVDKCVDIVESEDRGRYMMSNSDRPKDSVILKEKAQYSRLHGKYLLEFCNNCHNRIGQKFFPCIYCTECIFCNKKCYEEAMFGFHFFECRISKIFYELSYHCHLAYRILLTTGYTSARLLLQYLNNCSNSGNYFDVKQWIEKYNNQIIPRDQKSVEHKREEFEAFLTFLDHNDSQTLTKEVIDIFEDIEVVTLIDISHAFIIEDDQTFISLTNALITIARKIMHNSFSGSAISGSAQQITVSIVICLVSAMCNHSCVPNVKWKITDDKQQYTTIRPLKAGQEINTSYGPIFRKTFSQRQKELKDHYNFTCSCVLCTNESQGLLSLRCLACSGPVFESGYCLICDQQALDIRGLKT